jgi:hypothetical protein
MQQNGEPKDASETRQPPKRKQAQTTK